MADVIVALDLATSAEAVALVDRLPGVRWVKIGPTLFLSAGPSLIRELKDRDVRVFLDLKWHDIPHQVGGAVAAAAAAGVDLATVHALGGPTMMRAAAEAAGGEVRLVAVTVLTSHTSEEYAEVLARSDGADLVAEADRLAGLAARAGLHGVVASAFEVTRARAAFGEHGWFVVPGIRPPGFTRDDQRRTMEPAAAVAAGATHLVVGRPITRADDPALVYQTICEAAS